MIAKKEGLRGFYVGGLMTSAHDGVSSGIFFATCKSRSSSWRSLRRSVRDQRLTRNLPVLDRFRFPKTAKR